MKKVISCLFGIFGVMLLSSTTYALTANEVHSGHIAEADGSSGQATNSGQGVKRGHIQDNAISKEKLADDAVGTDEIENFSIGENDIANGAVTNDKISGTIAASKISSTGLDADTVDGVHASGFATAGHTHDGEYEKRYGRIVVVSADGNGDFTDVGDAIDSISDASESNPYLVKIMPGVFNSGNIITAKSHVDIEGSGRNVTTIGNRLAITTSDCEIRHLTIEHNNPGSCQENWAAAVLVGGASATPLISDVAITVDGGTHSAGILIFSGAHPIIKDVSIAASTVAECGQSANGIVLGFYATGASADVSNATVNVSGYGARGLYVGDTSTVTLVDSVINGDGYGISAGWADSSVNTVKVHNCRVYGGSYSIALGAYSTLMVAGSQVVGTESNQGGTLKYVNCYDEDFDPIP